jgi:photosystem II stability/assembly factor-like uncharacterized protein
VILRQRIPFWSLLAGLVAAGLLGVLAVPTPSAAEELTREQQIADLERQIQELTKRLTDLKALPPLPTAGTLSPDWVKALTWRPIGPASMGGRIVDLAVFEADPTTYWVATASGGLLKTVNNGVTFEHQFDREATVSIGAVAVAPSDRNVVWVGTGEANPRNSASYGDGVYKSTDGGKTWKNMGLKKSFQVGRIVIHPTNPNIVYVGALGRLWGPNEERGLFKTTDGGESWERVLYVDDKTGVIDLCMNPANPEELLVATWERRRDGFDSHPGTEMPPAEGYDRYDPIVKWGPGSGIFKTTDGGRSFHKLTAGLPNCALGRIGLDYYRKDPKVVYAIVDCEKIGMGTPPSRTYLGVQGEDAPGGGARLTDVGEDTPAGKAGLKTGDVVKAVDKKEIKTYRDLVEQITAHKVGDKLALTVLRGKDTQELTATLGERPEAQGGGPRVFAGILGEDTSQGVRLPQVSPDTPAGKAGLQAGDVIQAVDKKEVKNQRELAVIIREHEPDDKITLKVLRGKETKDIVLTLEAPPGVNRRRPYSFQYGGQRPNVQDQQGPDSFQYGGVYRSADGGESWARVNSLNPRPMYFSQVRVDAGDEKYLYVLGIALYRSSNGGRSFEADGGNGVHPDQHTLWIDPHDGRHMVVGCDGGFYATYDRMQHWDYLNHVAIGQFYAVAVDGHKPYRAFGGLQDNGTWGIPTHSLGGQGPTNADSVMVGGGDGFQVAVDPTDPDLVYFESQDGAMARRNLRTGERSGIRPPDPKGQPPYRFNWNTPFILSHQNPRIFYCAGNYVFRSLNQGNDLRPISPEITRTKRGSGTALAESPRNPEVLYVGTDDGNLQVTRDGGNKWDPVKSVGLPGPRWVASIEPSRHVDGRCYVAFDGHRSDDDEPYVYVTEDYGQTWKSLRANLPPGSTRVLREDLENPNLLYLGTEFAAWVSLNRGESWTKVNNNLPTVAVHEFAQHPTAGEIVAATHGRSLWVLDVSALRQMTPEVLKAKAHLFKPVAATRWRSEPDHDSPYGSGSRHFRGQNPPGGAQIYYALDKKADKISLKVADYAGRTVREWPARDEPLKADAGLHRVSWDLRGTPASRRDGQGQGQGQARGQGGFRFGLGGRGGPQQPQREWVAPGMYRVVLTVNGEELTQGVRVEVDPLAGGTITTDEADDEEEHEAREAKSGRIDD